MYHRDYVDWLRFPCVADDPGIKRPKAEMPVQQVLPIVADSGRPTESFEGGEEFDAQAFGGSGTIVRDRKEDFPKIRGSLRRENEAPPHEWTAFFLGGR